MNNVLLATKQKGQDLAEYGLLIGFIALIVMIAVGVLGESLLNFYNSIIARWPF